MAGSYAAEDCFNLVPEGTNKCLEDTMKKTFFLLLVLCLFTACRREPGEEADYFDENGYVFTISTPTGNQHLWVTEAAGNLEGRLASEGIHVRFEIDSYLFEERDVHLERKLGRFAAGMGPDIFVWDFFSLYPFVENAFIRDIYPLLNMSENMSLDDFFINPLRSHEFDGRLYTLPMTFGFDFVGINSNVPREFLNRFLEHSHISIPELAAIYNDLIAHDPAWGEFAFMNTGGIHQFLPYINSAVNMADRRVSFPAGTADLLEVFRNVFLDNNRFGTEPIFTHNEENLRLLQERYVFFLPIGTSAGAEALFDFQTTFFTGFIPRSKQGGGLVNTSTGVTLVVSSSAVEWLALAFIEEMLDVTGAGFDFAANSHITRRHARRYLVEGFERALTQFTLRPIVDTQANAVAGAAEKLIGLGDFPVMRVYANWYIPPQTFSPALQSFMAGEITAAEAVSRMEAGIAGFFDAETEEIAPYVPAPVFAQDSLQRTFSVMTTNTHTGVLEQAARLINTSWQAQGIPYLFVLEVYDWNWTDLDGNEARASRLAVELMAGGGPDMFLVIDRVTDVRSLAERGLLADINTLIENHSASNRSDFYEHVLDALEINGGLFVFPVSFGFHRAGINTAIPQPFIERFMGYESISLSGLLDFYLDFAYAHGHEYGHLRPGAPRFLHRPVSGTMYGMAPFIDFERRTSNLNSTLFSDFLTSFMRVLERHESIYGGWVTNFVTPGFALGRQREKLFDTMTFLSMPVEAFLSRPEPFFTHYILLTDNYGNLIFDITDYNTWGTWAITASGDSALAWEFMTYVLEAYYAPTGRAAVEPVFGTNTAWNDRSISTPIRRTHFESRTRRVLEVVSSIPGTGYKHEPGTPEWDQEIENAIRTMAAHNEMPVIHVNPLFPPIVAGFLEEPLEQLQLGIVTAETAASRIHNSITIWLLE